MTHEAETTTIDQIHDELQLVQTFEVRHFGRVSRFGECFESGLNQRGNTATEHRLLAEQVGFRLLGEGGADHAGTGAADPRRVGERVRKRGAAGILMYRD